MKDLKRIIIESADMGISLQHKEGYFEAGRNGPWGDIDTPVRITSHWCLLFLEAYRLTGDGKYLQAAINCENYLLSKEARPMGATFFCRKNPKKDFCNGLIGQAWVIKALMSIGIQRGNNESISTAIEVFNLHDFDSKSGLWKTRNVDGSQGAISLTFNQQLWFAVVASMIYSHTGSNEVKLKVDKFLENIFKHVKLSRTGRIHHTIANVSLPNRMIRTLIYRMGRLRSEKSLFELEIGYHSFNLYGFALLYQQIPDHKFWTSAKTKLFLEKILSYTETEEFTKNAEGNDFAYAYNPVGFEVAQFVQSFSGLLNLQEGKITERWVKLQAERHYNNETKLMDKNTKDKKTLASRLYEAMGIAN